LAKRAITDGRRAVRSTQLQLRSSQGKNYYTILRRADGAVARTAGFDQGGYTTGELRIDPSPNWNRDGTQFIVAAADAEKSRQMFIVTVKSNRKP
jgi:hypothetical protein